MGPTPVFGARAKKPLQNADIIIVKIYKDPASLQLVSRYHGLVISSSLLLLNKNVLKVILYSKHAIARVADCLWLLSDSALDP